MNNNKHKLARLMAQAGLLLSATALVAGCGGSDDNAGGPADQAQSTALKENVQKAYNEYADSLAGKLVQFQGELATPNVFLAEVARGEDSDAKPAPYWYVRNGVHDDGVSLMPEAVLYANLEALKAKKLIADFDFRLVMNLGHSDNVNTDEAFAWMDSILAEAQASQHVQAGNSGWWDVTQYPEAAEPNVDPAGNVSGVSLTDKGQATLTVTLDGKAFKVTHYWGTYAATPNSDAQIINIYVPENATADSATYFRLNNSGWIANSNRATVVDGQAYTTGKLAYNTVQSGSGNNNDVIGEVLNRGMLLVSYGARTRGDAPVNGVYQGHSPATMTDTKAAIRFVKYNMIEGSLKGDPNRIILTGMSGGGGLSTTVAASGNSAEYFESLVEIGALGITEEGDTYYHDGRVGDNVFATFSSAPIIDLAHADYAIEWMYNPTRQKVANGDFASATGFAESNTRYKQDFLADWQNLGSNILGQNGYPDYITSLGLTVPDVKRVLLDMTEDALEQVANTRHTYSGEVSGINDAASATTVLQQLLRDSYGSWNADGTAFTSSQPAPAFDALPLDWFTVSGAPGSFDVTIDDAAWADYTEYLYWTSQWVKATPGSDNMGLEHLGISARFSESNLWGLPSAAFGHTNPVTWAMDADNWSQFGLTPSDNADADKALAENQELAKSLFKQ